MTNPRDLFIGGSRSGKSRLAEAQLRDFDDVVYVATGYPPASQAAASDGSDQSWADRVAAHQARRPASWQTLETLDLEALVARPGPALLVDCLTLWLTRTIDALELWETADWGPVDDAIRGLAGQIAGSPRRLVLVSQELGQALTPLDPATRRFVDANGLLNQTVAQACTAVWWCVAGRAVPLPG